MHIDKIKQIIENNNYLLIDPNQYHKGHGNALSVKVVIPTYCQANCDFCFNKRNKKQQHDADKFLKNLDISLSKIFNNVKREFTIDITGNEPTFNVELLKNTLDIINKYRSFIFKIVLTTNGFKLMDCLSFIDMVDIINISVHHYDFNIRKEIFKTNNILNDTRLKSIISDLKNKKIAVSAICVLNKEIDDFEEFYNQFSDWAISLGFSDIRMRSNYLRNDSFMDKIYDMDIGEIIETSDVPGLKSKKIYDSKRNYYTYIFLGVESLVNIVIGAEMVIDDDGLLYIDYNKEYPISDGSLSYFNRIYVLGDNINEKRFK